jgi:hypothetical protein
LVGGSRTSEAIIIALNAARKRFSLLRANSRIAFWNAERPACFHDCVKLAWNILSIRYLPVKTEISALRIAIGGLVGFRRIYTKLVITPQSIRLITAF